MVTFGVVLLLQISSIEPRPGLPVGPRLFPTVIISAFLALSTVYLGQQVVRLLRGLPGLDAEKFGHPIQVALMLVLLAAYTMALEPLGYVVSTIIFFVVAARVLGSRRLARDLIISMILAPGIYYLFDQVLRVTLPQGVLPV